MFVNFGDLGENIKVFVDKCVVVVVVVFRRSHAPTSEPDIKRKPSRPRKFNRSTTSNGARRASRSLFVVTDVCVFLCFSFIEDFPDIKKLAVDVSKHVALVGIRASRLSSGRLNGPRAGRRAVAAHRRAAADAGLGARTGARLQERPLDGQGRHRRRRRRRRCALTNDVARAGQRARVHRETQLGHAREGAAADQPPPLPSRSATRRCADSTGAAVRLEVRDGQRGHRQGARGAGGGRRRSRPTARTRCVRAPCVSR